MTRSATLYRHHPLLFLIVLLSLALTACGGGGDVLRSGSGEVVATLTWVPPEENTDNTPLEDLGGYRLYMGDSPNSLQPVIDIPASTTRFEITDNDVFSAIGSTATGRSLTVYFALTAYNSLRIESSLSEIVSKAF